MDSPPVLNSRWFPQGGGSPPHEKESGGAGDARDASGWFAGQMRFPAPGKIPVS